ncbi:MAG: HipA domain-containing protein [Ignavibacteria bacterium]|nr:HipA domain-containing protein [Ignavibacteria bacterium]
MNLLYCPSCLKINHSTFCKACLRKFFNGKKVSHILPFSKPEYEEVVIQQSGKISISGVQQKHSLMLSGTSLELTYKGGEYIIKPLPQTVMKHVNQVPANEHITMQIASQIYKINTAENALLFFKDNYEPCYLTKRFDRLPDGSKILLEDFTQISNKSEEKDGINYKYELSYEEIAELMEKNSSAYPIEVEKFFKLILINYLINNGDAHLKNFSLIYNLKYNDYQLSPAYDILNTRIHFPEETELALPLFKNGYETDSYKINGHFLYEDFHEFGLKAGIKKNRVENFLKDIISKNKEIKILLNKSFLSEETKKLYNDYLQISIKKLTPVSK